MERLNGIAVSPGVGVGRAVVLTQRSEVVRYPIPAARIEREVAALEEARERSKQQLRDIRERLGQGRGHELGALFDAQILMIDDPLFLGRALDIIRTERVNAAWAVHRAYQELVTVFADIEDPYLRERETDVADVAGRLRMNLRREAAPGDLLRELDGPSVLVADELTASLAAQLDWSRIHGFATDAGSRTYHTAILARSLKVPAVVGLHDASARIAPGTVVIVDGTTGELVIAPAADTIEEAQHRAARPHRRSGGLATHDEDPHGPARTVDGVRIRLLANVELVDDLPYVHEHGAEGVGLYRSEFMLSRLAVEDASEDVQYELYRQLLSEVAPLPVTVRTFDLDERQLLPARHVGRRGRGGLRGLRLGLARPEFLYTQLRALLRASQHGSLRIMFPFVTSVDEIRQARMMLASVAADLDFHQQVPIGSMIEVPAAAIIADQIAREVDFLTIGTNDLIQFCLAVDRTDDRVSDLYEPLHPSVLRLIRLVCRAGVRREIPIALCGEMASDPALLGLLVGLGLTDFSMTAAAIPMAREVVRDLDTREARRLAARALKLASAADIEQLLFDALASSRAHS